MPDLLLDYTLQLLRQGSATFLLKSATSVIAPNLSVQNKGLTLFCIEKYRTNLSPIFVKIKAKQVSAFDKKN